MKAFCLCLTLGLFLSGCASVLENPVVHKSEAYDYETDDTQDYMNCIRRKKKSKAKVEEPPCRLE